MEPHYYHVNINWSKERIGIMCSPELTTSLQQNGCMEVATPPQFAKGIPGIWSPEHLFTASVCSCFMTTFLAIAENSKLSFSAFTCNATGKLEQVEGKYKMTEVLIEPTVTLGNPNDRDKALRVLDKSEGACLISNSISAVVTMKPDVAFKAETTAA